MSLVQQGWFSVIGKDSGFTLIEILVAFSLLAVVIIALMSPIGSLYGQNAKSSVKLAANAESQEDIERARKVVLENYAWDVTASDATVQSQKIKQGLDQIVQERNAALTAKASKETVTLTCQNLNVLGKVLPGECSTANNPVIRRIHLVRTTQDGGKINLFLDVNP